MICYSVSEYITALCGCLRAFSTFSLFLATQELRRSQLESVGDPVQSGGVLLHIVQFRDLRGGVTQEVHHLPGRQGAEAPGLLPDAVHQAGGKGMPEGMQTPLLQPRRSQDTVIPLAEVQRISVAAVLVRDQGRVLSEVGFLPQLPDSGDGRIVQRNVPLAGLGFRLSDLGDRSLYRLRPPPVCALA